MTPAPARRTAAVVTWFHPPPESVPRLQDLRRQCDLVVVVDNTPGSGSFSADIASGEVEYVPQGYNTGLAAALNAALARVPDDIDHVLFLDQDSVLEPDAVERLARHLEAPDVAVAAVLPFDTEADRPVDPRRPKSGVRSVDVVITSGMLTRRAALQSVGPFREDFFVDGVDQDMCLRLRSSGWRILQDTSVRMEHALGDIAWHRVLGFSLRSTQHPTWRLYAASRNGAILLREHGARHPRWALTYVLQSLYWLLTVCLLEPPRGERVKAFLRGSLDGLQGRGSAGAPARG